MTSVRNVFLTVSLLTGGLLMVAALASNNGAPESVRFGWFETGVPALITLPLPADVQAADIEMVSLAGIGRPAGFEVATAPARLQLHLLPETGEALTFAAVDLRLESGHQRRFEFGSAAVVPLGSEAGPLNFERSLSVTAAGLYQAVVLRNDGEHSLTVSHSDYLPPPLKEGRLLVAKGEPDLLLSRLEAVATPAIRRHSRASGFPSPEGFDWREAGELDLLLAPREAVVLAWTDGALPALAGTASFELRPVVRYRLVTGGGEEYGSSRSLGLQAAVRRGR